MYKLTFSMISYCLFIYLFIYSEKDIDTQSLLKLSHVKFFNVKNGQIDNFF